MTSKEESNPFEPSPDSPIVKAPCGSIRGYRDGPVLAFKGIPYAEAPTGRRRFLPPEARQRWTDTLEALQPGPRSMQNVSMWGPAELNCSEDCLYLNVWTPAADGNKRPVVVQIHGGAHCEGYGDDPFHNGPHLIRNDQIVMVSINYRLGLLGYMDVSRELGPDYAASGCNGLLDQIQALRWVFGNIAAFGGDPDHVTIMGQSAGGKSVGALLVAPAAQGLFHAAILQSGAIQCIRDQGTARRITDRALEFLNLADPAELLSIPPERLLAAQLKLADLHASWHLYAATVDGVTFPEAPGNIIETGKFAPVPVLLGFNRDELSAPLPDPDFDEGTVESRLHHAYGDNAAHVFRKYRECSRNMAPSVAFGQIQTKYTYGNACLHLTRLLAGHGAPVWSYLWELGRNGLSHHSSEMPYIFGYTTDDCPDGYDPALSSMAQLMHESWLSFIRTGSPQVPGLPAWPPCTTGEMGSRMRFTSTPWVESLDLHAYDKCFPEQVMILNGERKWQHEHPAHRR